jgi:FixJ family two-component response regulator
VCTSKSLRCAALTKAAQALMRIKGHPVVAYDATGSVFAVAINERPAVLLYDVRRFNSVRRQPGRRFLLLLTASAASIP